MHSKFVGVLEKDGVEVIDPAGEAFDALEAQAVATVPDTEAFDETVQKRLLYFIGGRRARNAQRFVVIRSCRHTRPPAFLT